VTVASVLWGGDGMWERKPKPVLGECVLRRWRRLRRRRRLAARVTDLLNSGSVQLAVSAQGVSVAPAGMSALRHLAGGLVALLSLVGQPVLSVSTPVGSLTTGFPLSFFTT